MKFFESRPERQNHPKFGTNPLKIEMISIYTSRPGQDQALRK